MSGPFSCLSFPMPTNRANQNTGGFVSKVTPYYQDDRVTLYGGEMLRMLDTLEEHTVDAIITDPPYSSGGIHINDRQANPKSKYAQSSAKYLEGLTDFTGDARDQRGYLKWMDLWLSEAMKSVKPGGIIGVFSDWRQLPVNTDALQCAGVTWRGIVPWHKPNGRRQAGRFANNCEYFIWGTAGQRPISGFNFALDGFFEQSNVATKERQHIAQKPVEVMRQLVKVVPEDGIVLDPFMGSGSTGVACIMEGRRFIGCEMVPDYQRIAQDRITEATSQ